MVERSVHSYCYGNSRVVSEIRKPFIFIDTGKYYPTLRNNEYLKKKKKKFDDVFNHKKFFSTTLFKVSAQVAKYLMQQMSSQKSMGSNLVIHSLLYH